jgi:hypothetical protein
VSHVPVSSDIIAKAIAQTAHLLLVVNYIGGGAANFSRFLKIFAASLCHFVCQEAVGGDFMACEAAPDEPLVNF